jgi:SAM-dependent methyltransferase
MADAGMTDAEVLLAQIDEACRRLRIAQTTFGRLAVNDGKFVNRLQQGGRVTLQTVDRVHRFIAEQSGAEVGALRALIRRDREIPPEHNFRFYDNRQKYLMFVNTSSEKQIIADRALEQLTLTQPQPPAIRLFDGGTGDGTAFARLLRGAHRRYPWLPFYVVAKEISIENVRLMLEKMPDRFQEHPATVLVVTNLPYAEAPWLRPESPVAASQMVWHEMALEGSTAGDFEEAIAGLQPFLEQNWQVEVSSRTGHPVNKTPAVLVIYRRDNQFVLDSVLPRRGLARADFDFVLLSHAYRARAPIGFKAKRIVAPLVRALRPNGRLMGVHAHGDDPGMEIVRSVWPGEDPFTTDRDALMQEVRDTLGPAAPAFRFHDLTDADSLFRYQIRTLSTEIDPRGEIGTSTMLAAWNAASYVAQIEDRRLAGVMNRDDYLEATRAALRRHAGLWFTNETYIVSRRAELG